MNLAEKIFTLRKQCGMSQEELAEKLNVSRQAVSRWEVGSAQPDAENVLNLSRLFGVTADYLLNDDYESDRDVPIVKKTESVTKNTLLQTMAAVWVAAFGLCGNLIFYVLSRFVQVRVPYVTYQNGEKLYTWSGDHLGYSYRYFIETHNLEFLTVLLWLLTAGGLGYLGYIIYCRKKQKRG